MKYLTTIKRYATDTPFRCMFRDHTKTGEEGFLKGYALSVKIDFSCVDDSMDLKTLQAFVRDKTEWADNYLNELFANTVLISQMDPLGNVIIILETEGLIDVRLMRDVSLIGLSRMIMEDFSVIVKEQTDGLVEITDVDVYQARFA